MSTRAASAGNARMQRIAFPLAEICGILALLVAYAVVPVGVNSQVLWSCLIIQYGLMISSVWRPQYIYGRIPTFISAEFLFLFFSYLIFFYPYQLHVLGVFDVSQSRYFPGHSFPEQSNHAIILCLLGTISFRAGLRARRLTSIRDEVSRSSPGRLDRLQVDSVALPVFALQVSLIASYQLFGWRAEAEGRYTNTTSGGPFAEGLYTGITVLSMVAVALMVFPASKEQSARPLFLWLSVGVSTVWATRILLAGDRNGFLLIAIVAIGGLFTFRIRAGRWALAALCAVALTMYNVIEQFRKGQVESLFDFIFGGGASEAAPGDTSFNISTITVRAAIANVPEYFDYGYGLFKLVGIAGVIPFIRGAVIPPDMAYTQSSDVLVMVLLGPSASWGVGTNIMADVYMDFGIYSVPLFLFLLGVGVAYTQESVMRLPDSPWRAVFYLMTLALVAEMPRYSFTFPVRPLMWVLFLFSAIALMSPTTKIEMRKKPTDQKMFSGDHAQEDK